MDFMLVYFDRQLNMPDELAGGALTAMKGFRFHIPGHTPFFASDTQGIAHHAQLQGGGINAWGQRFQIHCIFIFIEIGKRVTSGASPREKCRAESRLMTRTRLVENSVDLPT
jgi:hypothetical protein